MLKNPLSEQMWSRLKASIAWSERQIEFQKRKRLNAIQEFTGYHYAVDGAQHRVPVPMLALAVQIYVRQLAARAPRALCTTKCREYKPIAANMELAINQIPDEIGLSSTLRRMVMEALFSIGVVKVGLYEVGHALEHKYGCPFVDVVPLDNYFLDMSAKEIDSICYEGNQYWLDYDDVMESDWLEKSDRDELKPDEYTIVGVAGEPRAEGISSDGSADQYHDRLWLRDIWLPKEKMLLTMGAQTQQLLKVVEWDGPDCGPYYKLGYCEVPGNLLPLPPVSLWKDLHELGNRLFRKLGKEAESFKSVLGFQGGDEESVNNFKNASDGDGIRYTGSPPVPLQTSGVDQRTLAFYLQCRDLFSYFAGNLDNLGGLEPQAKTLGQDKLLTAAASAQMQDMADRTASVIRDIFYALAYYEWNDPVKKRKLEKPIPGTESNILVDWNRKSKKGKFEDYEIDIDVYSLQDNSPGVRLQKLGMIMQQYIMPLAGQIQQAGGTIDVQTIMKLVAKYSDFPELEDIVQWSDVQPDNMKQGESQANQGGGDKTVTRVGQPGMSRQGADASLTQQLMGGNLNETAAAGPVSPGH